MGSRDRRPAPSIFGSRSNVVHAQAGYLARLVTEAPETQIYFINHRSGANSVPRVRTVVRGETASRSIVNRTTALWSIWVVALLILAVDYRWGSMGSNETATATTGGPRVIDVFYENGVPSGPNYLLFSDADRLSYALRDRSGVG